MPPVAEATVANER